LKDFGRTGIKLPSIGIGTWGLGGDRSSTNYQNHQESVNLIRTAIDSGLLIIDTAEIYGQGYTEQIVGEAVKGRRDEAFIISKLWAGFSGYTGALRHAEGSLRRLDTPYIDLFLLHSPPLLKSLRGTMKAFERLVLEGKTRFIGLSNFSVRKIEEARTYLSKVDVMAVENEYNLLARGDEQDVIPYCEREGIAYLAYSPLAKGSLITDPRTKLLERIGVTHDVTQVSVALNWLTRRPGVFAIPMTSKAERLEHFNKAMNWELSPKELANIVSNFKQIRHPITTKFFRFLHEIPFKKHSRIRK